LPLLPGPGARAPRGRAGLPHRPATLRVGPGAAAPRRRHALGARLSLDAVRPRAPRHGLGRTRGILPPYSVPTARALYLARRSRRHPRRTARVRPPRLPPPPL